MSQREREACTPLVEDSPPDAAVARYALTAAGGGSVEHYSTLGDALERLGDAARPVPTVVLLDLSLPDSSGIETFDRLAALGPTPVVVLTGDDDPFRALVLIERGAQDCLVKGQCSGAAIARSGRQAVERSRLHEDQRKAREQVEAAVRAQRAFVAAMSHEVRTPLHAILGMSDLLAQTPLEADQREYVEISRRCGRALKGLLDNALELLRLESGGIELAREPFELEAVVQECLESFAFAADQKGIRLLGDMADDAIGTAVGDPGRLRQVLFNLVGNAVKFTELGRVVVSVRSTDAGGVAIEVADTGIGIRRDRQTAVFERFVQAESVTTRRYGGSGLGLALCRELVTAMGGEIGIESEPGKGSVFRITLPLHVEARESRPSLAAQRILVALADPVESDLLASRMQRRGASVHRARTSAELERLLRSNLRFDALLLDFRMPESGALDLLERLELAGCVSARRVVLLPLKHRAGDLARCTALGAVGLYKPARWENVVCALRGGRVESAAPHEESAASFEGRRILLAEDAPENQIIALTHLRKAGCSVEVAVDGEEAVEKHRLGHFDLILMDVHMPGVDGCQATRRIRASERQAGRIATPIVALTADALPEQKAECEAAGCDAHLGKPFTRHDLYSVLRRFLPAPEIPVSTRLASAPEATEQGGRLESRPTRSEPEASEGGRLQWLAQIPRDVADLAEEYLGNRRADAEMLRAATERGDFAEARRLGHNMKGSGAGYGFPRVTQLGAQIEQSADHKDAAEIEQLAGALSEYAEKRLETLAESTRGAGA